MTAKVCENCEGTGKVHSHCDICWVCDGTGKVPPVYASAPSALQNVAQEEPTQANSALIERITRYLATSDDPTMIPCAKCGGKGYHHGFREHGRDPDWCTDCGGFGSVLHPDENVSPDDLLRLALEALSSSAPAETPPHLRFKYCGLCGCPSEDHRVSEVTGESGCLHATCKCHMAASPSQTPEERPAGETPEARADDEKVVHRQGSLLYTLMHDSWRKGVEQFRNRLMVRIERDKTVPDAEYEAMFARLAKAMQQEAHPSPAPPEPIASAKETRDSNRCALCGWPLRERIEDGCVRGNCSMRPIPTRFYDPTRAANEYGIAVATFGGNHSFAFETSNAFVAEARKEGEQ